MNTKRVALMFVAVAVGLIVLGTVPLAAQEDPPPIAAEFLTPRSTFTDDVDLLVKIKPDGERTTVVKEKDPSQTVVARFTVQPGAQFPWHSHAGAVVVNIVEGSLIYIHEDCDEREYTAGTAFVDPGHGHVHSARNPGTTPTVFVATFFGAPESGPLLIPADPPACAS
ncbi:MAG TPA: cupin domain-containing protein [Acidimicrobiia bacterium]